MVTKSDLLALEDKVNMKMCTAIDETSDLLKRSSQKLAKKVSQLERSMSKERQMVSRVDEMA